MLHSQRTITTIDAHAAGEPLRIVAAGAPPLHGRTMFERRREMLEEHDHIRRILMWEPRGHADMYGAILTPPVTPEADYGVLFMHNEGYSTMCGHGVIALTTALIETGMYPMSGQPSAISDQAEQHVRVGYDTPAGFVSAQACVRHGRVPEVSFENVASFVYDPEVAVDTIHGPITIPVVFGGAFYALVDAGSAGLEVRPDQVRELIDFGMAVKHAVQETLNVAHPEEPDLRGIYGAIITGVPSDGVDGQNVTIFADGEVDRSPCGTGTAARLAWLYANGQIGLDEPYVHESIIGTRFTGRVLRETTVSPYPAIVPEISGRGFITGFHTFVVDPDDPARDGFLMR